MSANQRRWPTQWLMTDDRMGDRLWTAIDQLPLTDAGIVVRHYGVESAGLETIARRIAELCHRRGTTFAIARDVELARELGADLVHNPMDAPIDLPFSRSVHSTEEAEKARAEGAALVFVSPVRATRSHPGKPPLGRPLALRIAKAAGVPAIALGGMDARNFTRFKRDGFHGWAGIDAWLD